MTMPAPHLFFILDNLTLVRFIKVRCINLNFSGRVLSVLEDPLKTRIFSHLGRLFLIMNNSLVCYHIK